MKRVAEKFLGEQRMTNKEMTRTAYPIVKISLLGIFWCYSSSVTSYSVGRGCRGGVEAILTLAGYTQDLLSGVAYNSNSLLTVSQR